VGDGRALTWNPRKKGNAADKNQQRERKPTLWGAGGAQRKDACRKPAHSVSAKKNRGRGRKFRFRRGGGGGVGLGEKGG